MSSAAVLPLRGRPSATRVLEWAAVAAYLVLVFGPLAALAADAARSGSGVTEAAASIMTASRLTLLVRSAGIALAVAVAGMVLGTLVATVLARWRYGAAGRMRWLVLALAPIPAYVHALAWQSTATAVNRALPDGYLVSMPTTGAALAAWVQLMALLPLAVAMAMIALDGVPDELLDAGRVQRSDLATFVRVSVPLARPMVLAGGSILFALSLLDYSVPALFQVNVYALAVFADYSATNDAGAALVSALPLIVLAAAAVFLSQSGIRRAAQRPVGPREVPRTRRKWPGWFRVAQSGATAVLAASLVVVVWQLIVQVGSVRVLADTVAAARDEIAISISVAVVAAALSLPLAYAVAGRLLGGRSSSRTWWLAVTLPLAVPAPLIGIGLIALWNRPEALGVYGSTAMPVMAALARFVPFAAIVLLTQRKRIDQSLVDASRVAQTSDWHGWSRVRLPMVVPGLIAAACVTFALTMGELGATLIVAPPGEQTLTMRIFNYLHSGASDTVAGLCLAMTGAAVAAGLLALAVALGWFRLTEPQARAEAP